MLGRALAPVVLQPGKMAALTMKRSMIIIIIPITEVLDKQLRVKISDSSFE